MSSIGFFVLFAKNTYADSVGWLSNGDLGLATYKGQRPKEGSDYFLSGAQDCQTEHITVKQTQTSVPADALACVTRGANIKIAYHISASFNSTTCLYASFNSDPYMYPLMLPQVDFPNTCNGSHYIELIPGTDTIILESLKSGGWFVYNDAASRLSKSGNVYAFTGTNPYVRFAPSDKRYSPNSIFSYPQGYGYSQNGKYVAFAAVDQDWGQYDSSIHKYINTYRYFMLDLTTKNITIFSVGKYDSDNSSNHVYKDFGISNDGKYIAGGSNPRFNIWNVDNCAIAYTGTVSNATTDDPCVPRVVGYYKSPTTGSINFNKTEYNEDSIYFNRVRNFKFSTNNNELTFEYGYVPGSTVKSITMYTPGYTPERLNYLALGDSYSSGEGDTYVDPHTNSKRYRAHTDIEENQPGNQPREKCHISTQSYPYKLASSFSWNIADQNNIQDRWQTVACSGAQVYDLSKEHSPHYDGQGKGSRKIIVWNGSIPRLLGYDNKEQLKVDALNEFIPGRQKQIEFVEKYKPKVITLTIGGNDVGFGAKVGLYLLLSGTCDTATEAGRKDLGETIKGQFEKLTEFYRDLKKASPGVKIYVLGYPQAISDSIIASCPRNVSDLNLEERKVIVAGYWYMNQVIKTATQAEEVQYVDVEAALNGHRLCESGRPYANGLIYGDNWTRDEVQETFHPNADGHSLIANKFYEKLNYENPLTYSGYASDANTSLTEANIPNSAYLQTATPSTRNVEYKATTEPEQTRSSTMSVLVNKFTFLAGSTVQMVLHSDPVDLGTSTVATDGSMSATPTIPSTVPPGYHTLIISGQTPSGESIEYEQIILVKGEDPDDIDDNSVSDDQQVCGPFITPANEDADYDGIDDACDPEITDPILYVSRNGDITKDEDSTKLYVYRNTRASSVTGITTDYVDISTNPDNKEALVATSLDTQTSAIFNKFVMLEDNTDPSIKIPTILAKDSANTCIALQPINYLSPALNPTDPNYQPRGLTKLTQLPEGEECE